jgi:ABC-type amino acid transport system permease subunit
MTLTGYLLYLPDPGNAAAAPDHLLLSGAATVGHHLDRAVCGGLALGLNYSAYMTEIMRVSIQSVDQGQREAAPAIGMTQSQIMRRIIMPQALRLVLPPIGNQFIAMLKDTSLISVTGFVWEIPWLPSRRAAAGITESVSTNCACRPGWSSSHSTSSRT